jgi:RHS repeat-associated protein
MVDASGSTTYHYTPRGRIASEAHTVGSHTYAVSYSYDNADQLLGTTYPSGRVITYTRDSMGRITGVTSTLGTTMQTLASGIVYAPFGPITLLHYGNGIALDRTYDSQYRLASFSAGASLSRSYQFFGNDDIAAITDAATGVQTLDYDADRRLTASASSAATLGWSYDANGNRLTQSSGAMTTTYTLDGASNRLLTFTGGSATAYGYDGDGNTIKKGSTSFSYDAFNRVSSITSGKSTVGSYTYDGFNRRITKTVGKTTTVYVYDTRGQPIAEIDGSKGTTSVEYVYVDAMPVAVIYASGKTAGTYYVHPDHLGTPQVVTSSSGAVAWKASYSPFGAATLSTSTVTFNLRFPGQYFDAESGLHYNWNRYYDPQAGRYLTSDSIGLVAGINTYAYAGDNPLSHVDTRGLDIVVIGGGVRDGSLNLAGHIAVGVTGAGVFSYGNDTPLGSSLDTYIGSQRAFRNQTVTIIPTTAAQDAAALAYLMGEPGMNNVGLVDNCAVRTNSALAAAGISDSAAPFPGSVARAAMDLPGSQNHFIPQGGEIPASLVSALRQFAPPNVP